MNYKVASREYDHKVQLVNKIEEQLSAKQGIRSKIIKDAQEVKQNIIDKAKCKAEAIYETAKSRGTTHKCTADRSTLRVINELINTLRQMRNDSYDNASHREPLKEGGYRIIKWWSQYEGKMVLKELFRYDYRHTNYAVKGKVFNEAMDYLYQARTNVMSGEEVDLSYFIGLFEELDMEDNSRYLSEQLEMERYNNKLFNEREAEDRERKMEMSNKGATSTNKNTIHNRERRHRKKERELEEEYNRYNRDDYINHWIDD